MKLNFVRTSRGFPRADFRDRYNARCSIQESSIATDECIWLGRDQEVAGCGTRMHLTRVMALRLAVELLRFAVIGKLPNGRV